MSKRLKILNNEYSLTMQTKLNSSNYNLFVWVYKGKEKMPIYGSCFKENTPIKEIKQWAENRIKAPNDIDFIL